MPPLYCTSSRNLDSFALSVPRLQLLARALAAITASDSLIQLQSYCCSVCRAAAVSTSTLLTTTRSLFSKVVTAAAVVHRNEKMVNAESCRSQRRCSLITAQMFHRKTPSVVGRGTPNKRQAFAKWAFRQS